MDPRDIAAKLMDEAALIEELARAMADAAELVWNVLPDKPDAVCGHGMPEGCKDYWRNIARRALLPIIHRIHNEAVEKCAQKIEDYRVDWAKGTPENLQLAAEDIRTLRNTDHA